MGYLANFARGSFGKSYNVRKPAPDPRFIKAITTDPNLETIFLNMRSTGISLTVKKDYRFKEESTETHRPMAAGAIRGLALGRFMPLFLMPCYSRLFPRREAPKRFRDPGAEGPKSGEN